MWLTPESWRFTLNPSCEKPKIKESEFLSLHWAVETCAKIYSTIQNDEKMLFSYDYFGYTKSIPSASGLKHSWLLDILTTFTK
jgi:hypothetical protein